MTDALQPFPDVDPDAITNAGSQFQQASTHLSTAGSTVQSVAGTTAWTSTSARPAWDSALAARRADIANAQSVTEHIGNVLRTTGADLARLKTDYGNAVFMMTIDPDPRVGHVTQINGGMHHRPTTRRSIRWRCRGTSPTSRRPTPPSRTRTMPSPSARAS